MNTETGPVLSGNFWYWKNWRRACSSRVSRVLGLLYMWRRRRRPSTYPIQGIRKSALMVLGSSGRSPCLRRESRSYVLADLTWRKDMKYGCTCGADQKHGPPLQSVHDNIDRQGSIFILFHLTLRKTYCRIRQNWTKPPIGLYTWPLCSGQFQHTTALLPHLLPHCHQKGQSWVGEGGETASQSLAMLVTPIFTPGSFPQKLESWQNFQ
jgi:hypothetical protein